MLGVAVCCSVLHCVAVCHHVLQNTILALARSWSVGFNCENAHARFLQKCIIRQAVLLGLIVCVHFGRGKSAQNWCITVWVWVWVWVWVGDYMWQMCNSMWNNTDSYVTQHMWHTCNKTDSCVPYATLVHMTRHTQHLFIWHAIRNTCSYVTQQYLFVYDTCATARATTLIHTWHNNTDSYVTYVQQPSFICATTLIHIVHAQHLFICNATTHLCDACAKACATTLIYTWHNMCNNTDLYVTQQYLLIHDATTLVYMWCNNTYVMAQHICDGTVHMWCNNTYVMAQYTCDRCSTACATRLIHLWHTQHLFTCDAKTPIFMWHMWNSMCNNTDSYVTSWHLFICHICAMRLFICDTHNTCPYVTQRQIYVMHVHSMCNNTDWYVNSYVTYQQNWFICDTSHVTYDWYETQQNWFICDISTKLIDMRLMCNNPHSYVTRATLIHTQRNNTFMWHMCSSIRNNTATTLQQHCNNTDLYVIPQHFFKCHICALTLIHIRRAHHSYDSFICVTSFIWLIHMCEIIHMTHSYVWHHLYDSFICVKSFIWMSHINDVTHMNESYEW